jgi:hypothetical protein
MILNVVIEEQTFPIEVPEGFIAEAEEFFSSMDADMDKGWQMSRDWVQSPDAYQRCQIVGDKILTAIHSENKKLLVLLAGYVLARIPGISAIRIDTNGEMLETELVMNEV